MIQKSQENIHNSVTDGKHIYIMWVPSHTGIVGNEIADVMAKEAIKDPVQLDIPTSTEDIKKVIKNKLRAKWNNMWREVDDSRNHLRHIKTTLRH